MQNRFLRDLLRRNIRRRVVRAAWGGTICIDLALPLRSWCWDIFTCAILDDLRKIPVMKGSLRSHLTLIAMRQGPKCSLLCVAPSLKNSAGAYMRRNFFPITVVKVKRFQKFSVLLFSPCLSLLFDRVRTSSLFASVFFLIWCK